MPTSDCRRHAGTKCIGPPIIAHAIILVFRQPHRGLLSCFLPHCAFSRYYGMRASPSPPQSALAHHPWLRHPVPPSHERTSPRLPYRRLLRLLHWSSAPPDLAAGRPNPPLAAPDPSCPRPPARSGSVGVIPS
ncbi:Os04g0333001 [Oryza sativa Japonica Group]|uniref:Os04g0333001 protein n=2 Tax=Oryza sativa subsp. japonica TaxID=39947 RepID=B9FEG2_ORYSJ|nr:hypothetical protein OsJ_14289 [Oryza sativa Japonica Group]BAS88626.1 Os04g0333001 [Oryza sativa Japonica Group]